MSLKTARHWPQIPANKPGLDMSAALALLVTHRTGWKLNWTLELGVWWTTTPRQVDRGNNGGRCPGTNRPQWSVNTSIDIYPIGGLHSATQTPPPPPPFPQPTTPAPGRCQSGKKNSFKQPVIRAPLSRAPVPAGLQSSKRGHV